jgi:hypothetical protein
MTCSLHSENFAYKDNCILCKPLPLHTWDGGKTFNEGGFGAEDIQWFAEKLKKIDAKSFLETGAGNTTLVASLLGIDVYSVCWDADVIRRIEEVTSELKKIRNNNLKMWIIEAESSSYLPGAKLPPMDAVLIDGGHGFPTPIIDFAYMYKNLKRDGLIFVDDIQLATPRMLAKILWRMGANWFELLDKSPGGKTVVFRKVSEGDLLPDWGGNEWDGANVKSLDDSFNEIIE